MINEKTQWKVSLIFKKSTINALFGVTRHLSPLKTHPKWITKSDKSKVSDLDYKCIKFPVSKKDLGKIEKKNNICINVLCYENELLYRFHISYEIFKNFMDLSL